MNNENTNGDFNPRRCEKSIDASSHSKVRRQNRSFFSLKAIEYLHVHYALRSEIERRNAATASLARDAAAGVRRSTSASTSNSTWTNNGRSLLVLASQHGDEPCGVLAVNQLLLLLSQDEKLRGTEDCPSWPFSERGCAFDSVVFALGNPRAFAANERQIEDKLNRCFHIDKTLPEMLQEGSGTYERRRAAELAKLLSVADAVLDLHSASAPSPAFAMFPPSSPASASFSRSLSGIPFALKDFTGQSLGLAIEWGARHGRGGKTAAATLEAGQHSSPSAVEASVRAIRAALRWRGPGREDQGEEREGLSGRAGGPAPPNVLVVRRGEVVRDGFRWGGEALEGQPPKAFTRFKFGEIVARDGVKGDMRCEIEKGALIVLPAAKPVEGEDAFLWGEEEEES